jgi:hypothetical protein
MHRGVMMCCALAGLPAARTGHLVMHATPAKSGVLISSMIVSDTDSVVAGGCLDGRVDAMRHLAAVYIQDSGVIMIVQLSQLPPLRVLADEDGRNGRDGSRVCRQSDCRITTLPVSRVLMTAQDSG